MGPTGAPGTTILGSYDTYEQLVAAHPTGNRGDAYLAGGVLYVWDVATSAWKAVGSLIGPTGPTGAPGTTILGSYDTYEQLVAAHPTGTTGDAYLAGGVLYVWDAATNAWKSMGSLIGPTGPTGAAGASILGSYDTLAQLIAAHPTGTTGDAYLVGGVLYVWDAATNAWKGIGSLIGPTGPTGPVGTILDSFDTLAALQAAHPTGAPGDAYLAGGVLYVWDDATNTWKEIGSLIGPTGPTGAAGATILDSYDTYQQLINEHPTGIPGDAYLANGELYVWDAATNTWKDMGSLIGPTGPTGSVGTILGSYDTLADLQTAHPTGNQGDMYLVDGVLYVWDTALNAWSPVGSLRGPVAESRTIIPFSSQAAPLTTSVNGIPTRVSLIGGGYGDERGNITSTDDYSIPINASDGHFDLDADDGTDNMQVVFSLPFDMIIRSLVLTCGTWNTWTFQTTVYPYVQLYAAEPTSNSFRVIEGAVAEPEQGIGPGTMQRGTMRFAITEGLDIRLSAGTRIAIGALMRTVSEPSATTETYWLYFTGAIGMAYDPGE